MVDIVELMHGRVPPPKGEPYGRVKERARYMAEDLTVYEVRDVIDKLIESAPQQTLQALCDVLDPDAPSNS